MTSGRRIEELLERAPTRPLKRRLYRVVPALSYLRSARPTFLYTSGRPNRCNPAEVDCLYFSENETTALEEYLQGVAGTKAQHAPRLTFVAAADLRHLLDLGKPEALRALELTGEDLTRPWRLAEQPTRLQELGSAVSRQHRVQALRLPSVHGADGGAPRFNVAIFPSSLVAPSRLRVLCESGAILEDLP